VGGSGRRTAPLDHGCADDHCPYDRSPHDRRTLVDDDGGADDPAADYDRAADPNDPSHHGPTGDHHHAAHDRPHHGEHRHDAPDDRDHRDDDDHYDAADDDHAAGHSGAGAARAGPDVG